MQNAPDKDPDFEQRRETIRLRLEELEREFKASDKHWTIEARLTRIYNDIPDITRFVPSKDGVKRHLKDANATGVEGVKTMFVGGPKTLVLAYAFFGALGLGGLKAQTVRNERDRAFKALTNAATSAFGWGRNLIAGSKPAVSVNEAGEIEPPDGPV